MKKFYADPPRGCGRKVPGGLYAGADLGAGGALSAWTWVLGSGVSGGSNFLADGVPSRGQVLGRLRESLVLGEFVPDYMPTGHVDGYDYDLYRRLESQVTEEAIFDHIGAAHYTPISFSQEVGRYGPSRRLTFDMAKKVASILPVPLVCTYKTPVFRDDDQRNKAIDITLAWISDLTLDQLYVGGANWQRPEWGLYSRQDRGSDHYMRLVLDVYYTVKERERPDDPLWQEAMGLFDDVPLVEQPFGATWITRVDYFPRHDDDPVEVSRQYGQHGIGVIQGDEE